MNMNIQTEPKLQEEALMSMIKFELFSLPSDGQSEFQIKSQLFGKGMEEYMNERAAAAEEMAAQ